jgi:hypothetical protein
VEPPVGVLAPSKGTVNMVTDFAKEPEMNELLLQTAATMPAPKPATAKPVIADQFKPITVSPKPVEPIKPSANAVWDTIDTALERPIRYDQ